MEIQEKLTREENTQNMNKCPRFSFCSIPKCPLDYWMKERSELPGEGRCVLLKMIGKKRTKRTKGNLSLKMKSLFSFIREKNRKLE